VSLTSCPFLHFFPLNFLPSKHARQFIRTLAPPTEELSEADRTHHLVFGNVGSAEAPAMDHHIEVPSETHVETTGLALIKKFFKKIYFKTFGGFTVNPNSTKAYYWTLLIVICCVYNCLALAIFIFDDVYFQAFWPWVGLNFIADCVYLADIIVQTRFTIMVEGLVVKNLYLLFKDYMAKNRIMWDVGCVIPIDLLLFFMPTCSLLRTNRLLKMYRVIDFVRMTEQRLNTKHQNISKLWYLVTCCYILFHWNACIYFFFSLLQGIDDAEPTDFIFGYTKVFDVYISDCDIFMNDIEACIYNEKTADNR
ncbi:hypothetical protein PRIPAC_77281, partial [Pristionchus pacificus]